MPYNVGMRYSLPFALVGIVALSGCGGSGGGSGPSTPSVGTTSIGPLTLEGFVAGEPVHSNGTGSSVVGLSGLFSAVSLNNQKPALDQTQIAFAEDRRLFVIDYDGRNERPITGFRNGHITRISYSPGGGTIYFCDGDGLWSMFSNGGTPTLIGAGLTTASISPDGTKRLWKGSGSLGIGYSNLDGTGVQYIPGSATWTEPHWYDNGHVLVRDGASWFVKGLSTGSSGLSSSKFVAGGRFSRQVLFTDFNTTTDVYDVANFTLPQSSPTSGWTQNGASNTGSAEMSFGAFSPNGREFVAFDTNGEGSFASGYYLRRRNVDTMSSLGTVRIGNRFQTPRTAVAWQPFVTTRVVAGAGSYFGGDAHAVIFGRLGTRPGGVALARALTPASVKIAANAENTTGPNIVYTVEADRFTKLSYSLDKNYALANVPVTPTTNGVFFTFANANGEVVDAITYTVTRGSGKPTFRREGSLRVFEGTIQGVFDAKGKNLVPQGASQVKLDINGRVVSSR